MTNKISVPRGTADVLPSDISLWRGIEQKAAQLFQTYNYQEIRTPLFEDINLFKRSLGQTSEVVNKQLLELQGDNKEGFALRPEGTASVVRSYIENNLDRKEALSKLFYIGAMFRGERPQKGRLRQFHQIGAEVIGPAALNPYLDAEVITLAVRLLEAFSIKDFKLKLNTLGSSEDKENFSQWLRKELKPFVKDLSENDQARYERNVFRVLDSKDRETQAVIKKLNITSDYLSKESKDYYAQVKTALQKSKVNFEEDFSLVRGLDYYTHTVFEISCPSLGSQDALGAGGRYNNLVSQLGGPSVDAVGFALGIERIILAMENKEIFAKDRLNVYIICLDQSGLSMGFQLVNDLRNQGISADMNFQVSSMKSQMRAADKSAARFAAILGEDEIKSSNITIKNLENGNQQSFSLSNIKGIIDAVR